MKNIVVTLALAVIVFELFEHVIFPLFWTVRNRKRKSVCGAEGMIGKVVDVREWDKTEGRVFVNGEFWRAASTVPFVEGDRAIIERVEGLTLRVGPMEGDIRNSTTV